MIAVGITDKEWFQYCRNELEADQVNFWTPTPWNVRSLAPGGSVVLLTEKPGSKDRRLRAIRLVREYDRIGCMAAIR